MSENPDATSGLLTEIDHIAIADALPSRRSPKRKQ